MQMMMACEAFSSDDRHNDMYSYCLMELGFRTSGMPPATRREPLIEEKVWNGIVNTYAGVLYMIRTFILIFPCLWAGYERGRRKEERLRKQLEAKKAAQSRIVKGREERRLENRTDWLGGRTEETEWWRPEPYP